MFRRIGPTLRRMSDVLRDVRWTRDWKSCTAEFCYRNRSRNRYSTKTDDVVVVVDVVVDVVVVFVVCCLLFVVC